MTVLTIDAASTALVLIDLQRGILTGNLVPNTAAHVLTHAAQLAAAFRKRNALVVLVHVDPGPNGVLFPRPQADTPRPPFTPTPDWTEFAAELNQHTSDAVVTKHQPNAFYCTDLQVQLQRHNIRTIVLCGVSTHLGVESTARAAFERGYEQIFVAEAMTSRAEVLHTHTVTHILPTMGRMRTTAEVVEALSS